MPHGPRRKSLDVSALRCQVGSFLLLDVGSWAVRPVTQPETKRCRLPHGTKCILLHIPSTPPWSCVTSRLHGFDTISLLLLHRTTLLHPQRRLSSIKRSLARPAWRPAAPMSLACTNASARRLARAALVSSSKAPIFSITPRLP